MSIKRDGGFTLAKVIGHDADSEDARKKKVSDAEQAKLWAYIGSAPHESKTTASLSFSELLKQAESLPVRKVSYEDKTLGKDFHTKRAWGMAPEEIEP